MSSKTKKGGLFTAASVLLLINMIAVLIDIIGIIVSVIVLFGYISFFGLILGISGEQGAIDTAYYYMNYTVVIASVFAVVCIAQAVVFGMARKKLLKANSKKEYMGWMIACIVLSALPSASLLGPVFDLALGLVGPILALCVPDRVFKVPEDGGDAIESTPVDNTASDF